MHQPGTQKLKAGLLFQSSITLTFLAYKSCTQCSSAGQQQAGFVLFWSRALCWVPMDFAFPVRVPLDFALLLWTSPMSSPGSPCVSLVLMVFPFSVRVPLDFALSFALLSLICFGRICGLALSFLEFCAHSQAFGFATWLLLALSLKFFGPPCRSCLDLVSLVMNPEINLESPEDFWETAPWKP